MKRKGVTVEESCLFRDDVADRSESFQVLEKKGGGGSKDMIVKGPSPLENGNLQSRLLSAILLRPLGIPPQKNLDVMESHRLRLGCLSSVEQRFSRFV